MAPRPPWRAALTCLAAAALGTAALPVLSASAASTDYESESAFISKGKVESNHAGYSGKGFVNLDNVVGSYLEYSVDAAQAGTHTLTFRYANGTTADRPLALTVGGGQATTLSFPATGSWTTWKTVTTTVKLAAGVNKVRTTSTTADGGPNADKLTDTFTGSDDGEPPTPPKNLKVNDVKPASATFTWEASSDNVGVTRYEINRGGNILKTVDGNTLSATVDTLTPNTAYDISIGAFDAAGNPSQQSNVVTFTTPPSDDTTPPSAPGGLKVTGTTANSVSLAWNAATDNSGTIAGYDVYQGATKVATTTALEATVTDLAPATSYTFTVKSRDPNGNTSAASDAVTAKTTGGGTGGGGIPEYDRDIAKVDLAWSVGFLPDGSALATERDRFEVVHVTPDGQKTVAGKVPGTVTTNGEGGLLGLAVSPAFTTDHAVYLFQTTANDNRVVRMKYENGALSKTAEPVLTGIAKNRFHNGGRIRFGPDGKLYATAGDAKNGGNAQNKNSLNGKILRLNADGSAPSDNPFYGSGGNARYVWSYGHRNPQGLAWDSRGQLWAAEFGDSKLDELNLIQKGGNYGWDKCEGTQGDCSGYIAPKKTWPTSQAGPSGIEIVGDWIYVAGVTGEQLWVMQINAAGTGVGPAQAVFSGRWGRLRSVTKSPDGGMWLTSTNNDKNGGTPDKLDNVIVRLKFAGGTAPGADFKLASTAFADNAKIPDRFTCAGDHSAGQDTSPPLAWGAGKTGAKGYAIVFADVANNGTKLHWAIWDVPAATTSLPEGLGAGYAVPDQGGAKQKAMGSGANAKKFFGPCPGGSSHPYTFTLHALNTATVPGLSSSSTMAEIEKAIKNASTASVKLRGTSSAAAG
ncbi:YbhB/YbcL family Raf kinase inhibitor-like protein [Amycolatopsis samaneae]|uniref:YbhB/YbcL family Raf kinase inhibitor-like protein n=1 Tax=Amycolatopsis samaneae TaxID=664691 RepID=A0ABW5GER7_9PSEU